MTGILILLLLPLLEVLGVTMTSSEAEEKTEKVPDVLIIYSTGTSFDWKVIKKRGKRTTKEIEEIDAITTPTPSTVNCATIAQKLASTLREKDIVVRIIETGEIKHRNEILGARLVVIGSPAYFGNVSWEIKRLFDEQFHKIYMLEKKRLDKKRIAAFSMAEITASANGALKAIRAVVGDCRGQFGPTMIFLTKHSKREINKRITQFAEELSRLSRD